ncbi:MAG: glycosyltransferase family 1 protein [Methylococcaceae bacterium]|jgi:glycosyltransferase involved in cell wall biosynthesis
MKILLVGNYEKDKQFSMQKFASCLEEELRQQGNEVKTCKPTAIFGKYFKSTSQGLGKWLGYLDKYLLFPIILKKCAQWAEIIHICDHSNAMYVPYIKSHPHLVTCHDMMAIRCALGEFSQHNQVGKTGRLQQQWILSGLKTANHIAAVSNATKQDLIRLTNQPSNSKFSVIHNGLNFPFKSIPKEIAVDLLEKYGILDNTEFLLHVGGNQWYKNRKGVLEIYKHIINRQPNCSLKLVMAGQVFTEELNKFVQQFDLGDRVIELTEPTTEELAALYSLTTALIFPSLCEGFGWPIIEAQACNALVFTSNREPMTEIGGVAALYIDPEAPEQAATIIIDSLNNKNLIEKTTQSNMLNVSQFSIESMVKKYLSLYKSIISKNVISNENSTYN